MIKKLLFSILLTSGIVYALQAQDVIIKENGEEIKAKVTEVGNTEIKYKKFGNESGPTYTISKSELFMIKYANGSKDVIPVTPQIPVQPSVPTVAPASVSESKTSQDVQKKHENNDERKSNYFMLSLTPGKIKDADDYFFDIRMGATHNYSPYIGWDIFSLHLGTSVKTIENIGETLAIQLMTGIRGYSPVFWENKSAFGAFNIGAASSIKDITDNIGLCFEIEAGMSISKKFFVALVYNQIKIESDSGIDKTKFYGLRIGFHF